MKVISARAHGIIDYLAVAVMAIAPTVLNFSDRAAGLAYLIAGSYFVISILTRMPLGLIKLIPFRLHGAIEFIAGVGLMLAPWLLGFANDTMARVFFVTMGFTTLIVFLLTDWAYETREARTYRRI